MPGVVLLHGISRTPRSMRRLERALIGQGYATFNSGYPSRRMDLAAIAAGLAPLVSAFAARVDGPIHFVTHSMGGLVARVLLTQARPPRLGRVVMIAPPNAGSEVADLLSSFGPYRWWFGPAGGQLITARDEALKALFGPVDYELGVIAGSRSLYPFASRIIPQPNDGPVTVASTMLPGMADHLVLPVTHPMLARSSSVIEQTLAFLRKGRFD